MQHISHPATQQTHRRLRALPATLEQRLRAASPAQLAQWAERILFAGRLEQVFED